MESNTAFEPQTPAFVAPAAPKRGPEPTEIELPNPSANAVEEAKTFSALVVNPPEPLDVVKTVLAEAAKVVPSFAPALEQVIVPKPAIEPLPVKEILVPVGTSELKAPVFPVISMLDSETLTKIVASPEIAEALAAEGLQLDQTEIARVLEENKQRVDLAVATPEWDECVGAGVYSQPEPPELEDVTPEAFRDLKIGINASFEEVASLLLSQQQQIDEIEKRLEAHNKRGGHKI